MRRVVCVMVAACAVSALSSQAHLRRQFGAHVHGEATLDIAQDGRTLAIDLDAPGDSVLGFEHPPRSDEERQRLSATLGVLQAPAQWLTPSAAARCRLISATVTPRGYADADAPAEAPAEHMQTHDAHDHAHPAAQTATPQATEAARHAETDARHSIESNAEPDGHAEFAAAYRYDCATPASLTAIDVALLARFAALHVVNVNLALPTGQDRQTLSAGRTRITLAP